MRTPIIATVVLAAALASCVSQRPQRTEVFSENVYLPKEFLTRENPNKPGSGEYAWLFKSTIVKTSVPEIDLGALYMGYPGGVRYVRFQFADDKMEMVDDTEYAPMNKDAAGLPVVPPSLSRTVLQAWPGTHVDIQLRDNLDGERVNLIEENRERPWEQRQNFKVDFAEAAVPDVNMFGWPMSDYFVGNCLALRNVSLVPGSYEIEQAAGQGGDDYISWTLALTYELRINNGSYCYDMLGNRMDRSTYTYHVKYAFWRTPKSDYKPVEVAEKDPIRQVVGLFDLGRVVYHDPKTDLPGMRTYLTRLDPQKEHVFYFAPGFPDKYKDHFATKVAGQVNSIMESINVPMRISFKEWNDGGKERKIGDPRYSMIHYHDVPSTTGIGGMATWTWDPRTGEIYAAYLNLYHWVDDLYMNLLQEYLTEITGDTFEAKTDACKPGERVPISQEKLDLKYTHTSLYSKLVGYMNQPVEDWVPKHSDDFYKYMRRLIPDLTFRHPAYNYYVDASMQDVPGQLQDAEVKELEFRKATAAIDRGVSPFGEEQVFTRASIEAGVEHIKAMKDLMRNHIKLQTLRQAMRRGAAHRDTVQAWELGPAVARSSRVCKADGKWETRDEWAQRIIDSWYLDTATHEFGHDLGLDHNFYGNIDAAHFAKDKDGKTVGITSSIMEYNYTLADAADEPAYQAWDIMSLKYIYGGVKPDPNETWLFCTDDHTALSPFCKWHDIGITPTEIVKNEIEKYDWQYKFRNFRSYRKFWNTWTYPDTVLSSLYPLRRFLNLWAVDWQASDLKNDLKLLGATGDEFYFTNLTNEFQQEMGQANRLVVNFYKAILQQSAAERSYATKFDNFYGDITQQGIIMDKYFAMYLFVGLWPVDDYDQNIYSYLSYHEYDLGNPQFYSDAQDVIDSMVGGQYDVYPWFKPTAVLLFAQDTHDVMFGDPSKQKWIAFQRFDRVEDMIDVFGGLDPRVEALGPDNPHQTFTDSHGGKWIYYYMADRAKHLVANKDQNPIAYKVLWDQNEAINIGKSGTTDDYTIKYYLDFYEYFN